MYAVSTLILQETLLAHYVYVIYLKLPPPLTFNVQSLSPITHSLQSINLMAVFFPYYSLSHPIA